MVVGKGQSERRFFTVLLEEESSQLTGPVKSRCKPSPFNPRLSWVIQREKEDTMKSNNLKIFVIATLAVFIGAGVSMADGWKTDSEKRGNAYGHYRQKEYPLYQHFAPARPVYVEHHYRPVVVERHVYHPPVVYRAPAPSGYFFGMSVLEPGISFSIGVGGH
jgi:hypothetical protein